MVILCVPGNAFGAPYYHMKKQISLGKIRTGTCISSAKSCNPQEDKLPVLLVCRSSPI